jgi:hypothetical protein
LKVTPPSAAVPPQSCPSASAQLAGPVGGVTAQVPSVAPAATLQMPVQQLDPTAHESYDWPQNEEAWHVPPVQKPEQQSFAVEHPLPSVLHVALSAAHLPLTQDWLQQSPLTVQAPVSDVQVG